MRLFSTMNAFTFIEVLITIAIFAILASLAYPSYQDSIRKARRLEAHAGLIQMQLEQESFRMLNVSYAAAFGAASNDVSQPLSDYYTFSMSDISASSYTLKASANSGKSQASDNHCTAITLDQAGTKSPMGCW